jgi:serine/threonine protein phosphatase PrpC
VTDAEVSDLYDVLLVGNRIAHRRLPRGRAFFPLVVCELFDLRAVVTHDEDLPIRLRRIRISHLVLEAHAGTRERDELANAMNSPSDDHDICASFPFPFVSRFSEVPLGILENLDCSVLKFQMSPSDRLLLLSDGIAEATNGRAELFGFDQVLEFVRANPSAQKIVEAAQSFGQEDDISVISVTMVPVAKPALA